MPTKVQAYVQMANEMSAGITQDAEAWMQFLHHSARFYKYSFNDHKKYRLEYPIHSLRVYGKYDVGKVGESYVGDENILASLFSRTDDRNAIYQTEAGVIYQNEFYSGFSYKTELLYKTSYSTWLTQFNRYNADRTYTPIDDYTVSTLKISLRYSKDEEFFQGRRFESDNNHNVQLGG